MLSTGSTSGGASATSSAWRPSWPPASSASSGRGASSSTPAGAGRSPRWRSTAATTTVSDEPDALFARATAAGARVVRGLADEDYGSRGFTVRDPEGNPWSFGTYRGAR